MWLLNFTHACKSKNFPHTQKVVVTIKDPLLPKDPLNPEDDDESLAALARKFEEKYVRQLVIL